jgi:hypothetical protein
MVKRAEVEIKVPTHVCLDNCPFFVGIVALGKDGDNFNQVFCRAGCKGHGTNSVVVRDAVPIGGICEAQVEHAQLQAA